MPKMAANLSMLFNEVPFMDRFDAAAKAGFKGVEFLFPYAYNLDELQEKLHCSATIHMDPIVTDDEEVLAVKAKVEEMVHFLDESFSMHDFRMVKGSTRTNLIFDVEVPRKTSYTDNEIVNWLKERIHELPGSKYFAVIQIDHEYY